MENKKAFEATLRKEAKTEKKPILVRLEPKAYDALYANAERLGIRAQTIIRGLVRDYLGTSK